MAINHGLRVLNLRSYVQVYEALSWGLGWLVGRREWHKGRLWRGRKGPAVQELLDTPWNVRITGKTAVD